MKPIIILKTGQMDKKYIERLVRNGICVIESEDPSTIRFADPPPATYGVQERAAINLFRWFMEQDGGSWYLKDIKAAYCNLIIKGTRLQPIRKIEKAK